MSKYRLNLTIFFTVKYFYFKGIGMTYYKNQHYVPKWFQRSFIPNDKGQYWYLDLKPVIIGRPDGQNEIKTPSFWGVGRCFCKDDFYRNLLFKDPNYLEKTFYGDIDDKGARGIQTLFSPYGVGSKERFSDFLDFMDTLRLRTPKGIILVKKYLFPKHVQASKISLDEIILDNIRRIRGMHQTLWTEGVWFYLSAEKSSSKFIISDHPVVFFNKKISPANERLDIFMLLGTILIFPLDLNNCLIIFHRDYGINRELNPLENRCNARIFDINRFIVTDKLKDTVTPMHAQTKELKDSEVIAVNHIIKKRADKFIASYNKDDLFPEKLVKDIDVTNIENIVLPDSNMIAVIGNTYYGTTSGRYFGADPYGRSLSPAEAEKEIKQMMEKVKRIKNGKK